MTTIIIGVNVDFAVILSLEISTERTGSNNSGSFVLTEPIRINRGEEISIKLDDDLTISSIKHVKE